MNFNAWFKSRTADRVLSPLRKELLDLIEQNSTLLEVGCGTGDLLFQAAAKVSEGVGVDVDCGMIQFAESKRQKQHLDNLSFRCIDALSMEPRRFDISTSTLCLHELPGHTACALLKMMVECSKTVLIADFTKANTFMGKLGIEIDEILSGHYRNFRKYRSAGTISGYISKIGATTNRVFPSAVDGISIWVVNGKLTTNQ